MTNGSRRVIQRAALGVGLMALALGIAPARATAAITIGTVRSVLVSSAGATTIDIPNVGISGSNRYLLVGLCYGPEDRHTTVSVVLDPGGASQTSLTHLDSATAIYENDVQCQLWGTLAPPLGTFTVRATLVNTLVSGYNWIAGAWPLSGVDQTTPRGTVVANGAIGSPTVTVPSAAGEIVFGTAFMEAASAMQIQAPGVQDWQLSTNDAAAGAHRAGAASVTLNWTSTPASDKFAAIAVAIKPARTISYSVGTNTGDLKSGSPTVGIAGGVATFTLPQPNNIGVGDEVIYNGGTRAFITSRISSTVYQLGTAIGGTPPNIGPGIVVNSIKRAFNSLKAAATGSLGASFLNTPDLVTNDWQLEWPCYNDGPDPSNQVAIEEPWITGPNNYIRAYTPTRPDEVGVSQRHKGVAGSGYRIAPNVVTASTNFRMIQVSTDNGYVRIEGLELDGRGISGAQGLYGIDIGDSDGTLSNDIRISHNLIHGLANTSTVTTLDVAGINAFVGNPPGLTRVWNNVVYDIANVANASAADTMGIRFSSLMGTSVYYVYNNTVFDIRKVGTGGDAHGIEDNGVTRVHVKNNYVGKVRHLQGGQERCFSGSFASTNNNVSSDGTATGGASQINRSAYASYFRGSTPGSEDFHLVNDSFPLWGSSGADLDADANLAVTDDFDGTARHATTPDIGADEQSGSTYYRSVGTNGANLNTFPRTVQIVGTTATFSGAMPDNVGVGDVLTYNSGANRIAFISARLSSTQYVVWDKNGAPPTAAVAGTPVGVYRAYTSLANWRSGTKNPSIVEPVVGDVNPSQNLVASGGVMMVSCYGDGEDTTSVHIGSWTTGPANYIRIYTPTRPSEVGVSQRHDGKWKTSSAYRISNSAANNYVINSEAYYIRFDGLQVDFKLDPTNADFFGIRQTQGGAPDNSVEVHFSNNIVRMSYATPAADESYGILALDNYVGSNSYVAKLWNNVVYNFRGAGTAVQIRAQDKGVVYVHNNTLVGALGASSRTIDGSALNSVYARNNIAIDSLINYNQVVTGAGSSHNVSDTGDGPGPSSRNCEPLFVNKGGADFHLLGTDGCAKDFGADLSGDPNLALSFDIDSAIRTVPWDMGADDISATTEVKLQSFGAVPSDAAVVLEWRTASELDNLGFHVYRSLSEVGPWERLTPTLIPGLGSSPVGASYSWRDSGLANGTLYFYSLEDVDSASVSTFHGPVSAVPQAGLSDGGAGSPGPAASGIGPKPPCSFTAEPCVETHGDPALVSVRVVSRRRDHAVVELSTSGFYLTRDASGRVRVTIPGFEDPDDPRAPALPRKRIVLDAVVGRNARVTSVRAFDLVRYPGLVPAAVGHPEMDIRPDGTVRASRRAASLRGAARGYLPREVAGISGVAFQREQKKVSLEIAPLRYNVGSGGLVLARRVRVRVDFVGHEASEKGVGSRGRRRPRSRPVARDTLAFLHTSQSGLHAVGFETLGAALGQGLPVSELRLERQGAAVPFRVEPAAPQFGPGSVLYFHADSAAASTAFTGELAYELVRARDSVQMSARAVAPVGETLDTSSLGSASFETNRIYQSGLLDAEDLWQWEHLVGGVAKPLAFTLEGVDRARAARLTLFLQGASDAEGVVDHHLRVYLGPVGERVLLGETRFDGKQPERLELGIPPFALQSGANELTVENAGDTGVYSLVFVDRFEVEYAQTSELRAGRFDGRWDASGIVEIAGVTALPRWSARRRTAAPAALVALDVTDPVTPLWLTHLEPGPGSVRLRAEADRRYLLVSPEGVLTPRVTSAPRSTLRSIANRAAYVVIAPAAFLAAAEPLLLRREAQGLTTKAVSLEEITAAFGHGQPSASAIKDFLAFAYHSWQAPSLRYVLLLGDASHDPRNYSGTAQPAPLPAAFLRTAYLWTASDPSLAAVNGEDPLPDLAIGRLPAASVEQAQALVQKVLAWEDSGQGLAGQALLVADNPDLAGDFEAGAEDIRRSFLAGRPTTTLRIRALGAATRPAILDALNQGTSLVSYVGHGGSAAWASENVLNSWDVASLVAQSQQPFMLTMNCLNGYFIAPSFDSLAEAFLKVEGRGTIGAFSPSGLSLDAPAHELHRALMAELTGGRHQRLGDAVLAAQNAYADSGEMPELVSIYHLFGDPGMSIR